MNTEDNNTVTLRQLRYSFQEDEPWAGLDDETSVLFRLFSQPELRDDEQPDKLNVIKLICLGLMLCGGTYELKARVMYDVLQDNMQQKISSSDKDFDIMFKQMIVLSSYMLLRLYREESGAPWLTQHYPDPDGLVFQNLLLDFKESFLDDIFGDESNLDRGTFLMSVAEKTTWVFESEEVRARWNNQCRNLEAANH